ncbi:MAG: ABC transporter permease subunit [Candidatus Latescibacterota bacterium]|nr:ABC transporter permease subunit [Candidatus Latescibacterota bacterium]
MFWTIALRELRTNWQTSAYRLASLGLLVAMAASMELSVDDYHTRKAGYDLRDMHGQTRAGKRPKLTPSPTPLSVVARGLEAESERMFIITWSQPRRQPGATILDQGDRNPLLSLFPAPDPTHLVKFAMSLLSLFLAYDAICGERQRGTLKLLFAGPVSRGVFFAGKLIGVNLSMALALLPAAVLAAVGLCWKLGYVLDGESWYRILGILSTTAAFLILFAQLGIWASARARRSAAALLLVLAIWTVWMIGVPNLASHLARWISPVPPVAQIEAQKSQLVQEDFDSYIDYANACWAIDDLYVARIDEQARLTQTLSRLSPLANYTYGVSALAGTGTADARQFRDQVIHWDRRQRRAGYNWEGEIPFDPARLSFAQGLDEAAPDMACLLLWNAVFFVLGLHAFARSEIAEKQ